MTHSYRKSEISISYLMIMVSEQRTLDELVGELVHTSDDEIIGHVEAVNRNFVVVIRGLVRSRHYYIPFHKVEGWDTDVLWLKSTEEQVKSNYERNIEPDASAYYIKGSHLHRALSYPKVPTLVSRYTASARAPVTDANKLAEQAAANRCALCDMTFQTEDELSKHVTSLHL